MSGLERYMLCFGQLDDVLGCSSAEASTVGLGLVQPKGAPSGCWLWKMLLRGASAAYC